MHYPNSPDSTMIPWNYDVPGHRRLDNDHLTSISIFRVIEGNDFDWLVTYTCKCPKRCDDDASDKALGDYERPAFVSDFVELEDDCYTPTSIYLGRG